MIVVLNEVLKSGLLSKVLIFYTNSYYVKLGGRLIGSILVDLSIIS